MDNQEDTHAEATAASKSLPRNVKLLAWASCLNDIASETIFPLAPQFLLETLGGDRRFLGLIEGVADSTASLLKLWSGAWSDAVGSRRGFVLFGYILAAVVRPLTGAITAPWQMLAIRTSDRIGKGIRTAPRDAMIADSASADQRGRAFGFHRAMDHLGAAIGPVLATVFLWLWPGELRWLFALTLIPGLMVVALLVLGLKEPPVRSRAAKPFAFSLRPFDHSFRWFLLTIVVFTLGNSSDAFLLVRAAEVGWPTAALPML
ncbi:MAG: MFS transporter, partial [Planctomycetales bacterium]|nr:MFS transporter [Planctomycetales bacterium]